MPLRIGPVIDDAPENDLPSPLNQEDDTITNNDSSCVKLVSDVRIIPVPPVNARNAIVKLSQRESDSGSREGQAADMAAIAVPLPLQSAPGSVPEQTFGTEEAQLGPHVVSMLFWQMSCSAASSAADGCAFPLLKRS